MNRHFIQLNGSLVRRIILMLLFPLSVFSQSPPPEPAPAQVVLDKPENQAILQAYRSRAESFVAKNLNRFGLEQLQRYDLMLDSLYLLEKKDSIRKMEEDYLRQSSSRKAGLKTQHEQITQLTSAKAVSHEKYTGLLRKAGIAFLAWLVIVLFLLQFRKRRLGVANLKLKTTLAQLSSLQSRHEKGKQLLHKAHQRSESLSRLGVLMAEFRTELKKADDSLPAGNELVEKMSALVKKGDALVQSATTEQLLNQTILGLEHESPSEKVATSINPLCEMYLEIAVRGLQQSDPALTIGVTKDLEKNLPQINILPAAVGRLLLNVLNNAFLAVKEKQARGVKGYQPKVSISTRILPRFLQIRVKDNGDGMEDAQLQQATDEFFCTRPLAEGVGLGLSDSQLIMTELHKGELKIESQPGNGTDVYIKFYL